MGYQRFHLSGGSLSVARTIGEVPSPRIIAGGYGRCFVPDVTFVQQGVWPRLAEPAWQARRDL
jgi:hypothetical protein